VWSEHGSARAKYARFVTRRSLHFVEVHELDYVLMYSVISSAVMFNSLSI
jgi:hypothetical protein